MYSTVYPHMLEALKIGNTTFKNRVWAAPAGVHLLSNYEDDAPNDRVIAYYANKARGGSAVITYSAMNMDHYLAPSPIHANDTVLKPETFRKWNRLTSAIHFYGAKASLELLAFDYHLPDEFGQIHRYTINGEDDSRRMDEAMMDRIAEEYADAAENAIKCGFDMVLVHGGHGLPLFRILSPIYNKRDDEFGGSLENRMKFPLKVVKAIRQRVGKKLLIEYRISGDEMEEGGFKVQDCIEVLEKLQEYIDIAHVSAGSFTNNTEFITHPTEFLDAGCNAYLARTVKESGRITIPVLTLGAFQDPALIEQTLATGGADIVAMARGTIADAYVVQKAMDNRSADIIPCIRCLHCLDFERASEFTCSVNPTVGREAVLPMLVRNPNEKKKVVIVGGGPAGMEAAIIANQRGHEVHLYEKRDRLGGKLTFSDIVPFKKDMNRFMNWQIRAIENSTVQVHLNTELTRKDAINLNPDVIISAVGADFARPPIQGINEPNLLTAMDVYRKSEEGCLDGESFVVLGGGLVGCETALYLSKVLGHNVTMIEMQDKMAAEEFNIPRAAVIDQLEKHVTCLNKCKCSEIREHEVDYVDEEGNAHTIKADHIVLSMGMRANSEVAESFRGIAKQFFIIGDCDKALTIRHATRTGYDAAVQL